MKPNTPFLECVPDLLNTKLILSMAALSPEPFPACLLSLSTLPYLHPTLPLESLALHESRYCIMKTKLWRGPYGKEWRLPTNSHVE